MASSRKDNRGRVLHKGESQRKDGLYQYRYTDALNKRITIYDSDLNSLRKKEKEIEKKMNLGIDYSAGKISLIDQIHVMLDMKTTLKMTTRRAYGYLLPMVEKRAIGHKPIGQITMLDMKQFCSDLAKEGYAFTTIRKIKSIIKEALALACDDGILVRNPCDFDLKKVVSDNSKKVCALTKDQKNELLDFIKNSKYYRKYYDLFVFLLNTGIRIGEYCGITVDEIDFEKRELHIQKQLVEGYDGLHVSVLKTENANRYIPLTKEAEESIRNIIASRNIQKEWVIDGCSDFVCVNKHGRPRYNREINHIFKRIEAQYNSKASNPIPRLSPHVLRHTFCTELMASGAQIKSVQYIMGHAFASTTLDVYTDHDFDVIRNDLSRFPNQAQ